MTMCATDDKPLPEQMITNLNKLRQIMQSISHRTDNMYDT